MRPPPWPTLFPYTTLFRSQRAPGGAQGIALMEPVITKAAHQLGIDQGSEEHTSELQSPCNLVCRLLLEKKKKHTTTMFYDHEPCDVTSLPHIVNQLHGVIV